MVALDCGDDGCLFNLDDDPTEHVDLATQKPELLHRLRKRAEALDATVYQSPGSTAVDPAAKQAAIDRYAGFWGPWQDDASFTSMVAEPGWSVESCEDCA